MEIDFFSPQLNGSEVGAGGQQHVNRLIAKLLLFYDSFLFLPLHLSLSYPTSVFVCGKKH